jgi:hypothetical protein
VTLVPVLGVAVIGFAYLVNARDARSVGILSLVMALIYERLYLSRWIGEAPASGANDHLNRR